MKHNRYIDLHMHSTFSDGQFSPSEMVKIAKKNDVGIISITDHDDIRSISELRIIDDDNVKFINGVELSTVTNISGRKQKIHILGYDFDENNEILNEALLNKKNIRSRINKKYLESMIKNFDFISPEILTEIEYDRYIRFTRLIEKYINNKSFTPEQRLLLNEYLSQHKLIYPEYEFKDDEVIKLINTVGGIAVLAHPYQYNLTIDEEKKLLYNLKEMGLKGLEISHSGDTKQGMLIQEQLAKNFNLLETVGSDFHTNFNDFDNDIGYGKNFNLCKKYCSILKKVRK